MTNTVTFKMFTTPDCGYCPAAKKLVTEFAAANELPLEMIDLKDGEEPFIKYGVRMVPTVIMEIEGANKAYRLSGQFLQAKPLARLLETARNTAVADINAAVTIKIPE